MYQSTIEPVHTSRYPLYRHMYQYMVSTPRPPSTTTLPSPLLYPFLTTRAQTARGGAAFEHKRCGLLESQLLEHKRQYAKKLLHSKSTLPLAVYLFCSQRRLRLSPSALNILPPPLPLTVHTRQAHLWLSVGTNLLLVLTRTNTNRLYHPIWTSTN